VECNEGGGESEVFVLAPDGGIWIPFVNTLNFKFLGGIDGYRIDPLMLMLW
jgi:hypothetical protein